MVCYDFCAGFALRALCWEVWEDCIDLEGGVGQGDEKKVFLGGRGWRRGGGAAFGLSWEFYIQIQTEEHVEGFYTDASRQGQQFRVPQGTTAAAGGKEGSCFFTLYKPCLPAFAT